MLTCEANKIVEDAFDDMFVKIAKDYDLPSGDVTPAQEIDIKDCKEKLADVVMEYVEQNIL